MKFPFLGKTISFLILSAIAFSSCEKDNDPPPASGAETEIAKHINDSLWAYYKLNGNLADSSGNNHTLLLKNGAALTYDTWGRDGYAIDLDGNNDYGVIADGANFPAKPFTVSMYVMPRQNKGFFFGKQDYNTGNAATFNVGIDKATYGDTARFSVSSNQNNICDHAPVSGIVVKNNTIFYPNTWYHIVITVDKYGMKFYINKKIMGAVLSIGDISSCVNGQFILGAWWAGDTGYTNSFNGKLDELRIYTRALSAEEVSYLFDKKN